MGAENKPNTAIFVSNSDGSILRPIWPKRSSESLPSRQASAIRAKSQVCGVYYSGQETGYGFKTNDGKQFNVVTDGWEEKSFTSEFDARLAREVEARVDQEGLTIILY